MTESELVKQCQRGEQHAQQCLFNTYADRFYRLAFRYLKNQEETEDLLMISFTKIFRNIGQFIFREEGSLEGWMRKIIVNEALMNLRKKHNFNLAESLNTDNPEHDMQIFQDIDSEYLYQIILELPQGYRTVFNLYVIEGYDHREIADMLAINESTSRSQLCKARDLLKRKLKQEGIHYGTAFQ